MRTDARWRKVPVCYGPWQTVHGRFARWAKDGTLVKILGALRLKLDEHGRIDSGLWCVDATIVRASRSAAGACRGEEAAAEPPDHGLGTSRGGYGTKSHFVCDGGAVPLAVELTPGQDSESTRFEPVVERVRQSRSGSDRPRTRPTPMAADKGYSYPRNFRWPA